MKLENCICFGEISIDGKRTDAFLSAGYNLCQICLPDSEVIHFYPIESRHLFFSYFLTETSVSWPSVVWSNRHTLAHRSHKSEFASCPVMLWHDFSRLFQMKVSSVLAQLLKMIEGPSIMFVSTVLNKSSFSPQSAKLLMHERLF